ncbi:unnamed protein product [Citrullus colocynthis]|uniref:Uncharacterized protein n=1 Tax=Citrullus colocynthis TaxID=252529 RepID=A0ABP0ZBC6_9ROSI
MNDMPSLPFPLLIPKILKVRRSQCQQLMICSFCNSRSLLKNHPSTGHLLWLPLLFKLMTLTPFLFRSLVRLLLSLIVQPAASVSTLLFYSDILPQHMVSERLVRHELLDRENYLFHFLVSFLKCFW